VPDGDVQVDTGWLRMCASDCDGTGSAVQGQLASADDAVNRIRSAAAGWAFLDSLDDMSGRWEKLNKLLRDELGRTAEEFRFSASSYDEHENWFERRFHDLGKGWDEVLNYD
jgi:hypothetical protein